MQSLSLRYWKLVMLRYQLKFWVDLGPSKGLFRAFIVENRCQGVEDRKDPLSCRELFMVIFHKPSLFNKLNNIGGGRGSTPSSFTAIILPMKLTTEISVVFNSQGYLGNVEKSYWKSLFKISSSIHRGILVSFFVTLYPRFYGYKHTIDFFRYSGEMGKHWEITTEKPMVQHQ